MNSGGSSVTNSGTISNPGGDAIEFFGGSNTLTLAPGSIIIGTVLGNGSDTFQLGGNGASTFDLSTIGPTAQYQGFTTFNKIDGSTWTLTGVFSQTDPLDSSEWHAASKRRFVECQLDHRDRGYPRRHR